MPFEEDMDRFQQDQSDILYHSEFQYLLGNPVPEKMNQFRLRQDLLATCL